MRPPWAWPFRAPGPSRLWDSRSGSSGFVAEGRFPRSSWITPPPPHTCPFPYLDTRQAMRLRPVHQRGQLARSFADGSGNSAFARLSRAWLSLVPRGPQTTRHRGRFTNSMDKRGDCYRLAVRRTLCKDRFTNIRCTDSDADIRLSPRNMFVICVIGKPSDRAGSRAAGSPSLRCTAAPWRPRRLASSSWALGPSQPRASGQDAESKERKRSKHQARISSGGGGWGRCGGAAL